MKAKPLVPRGDDYEVCNPKEAKFIEIRVPGNHVRRIVPVTLDSIGEAEPGPVWIWNGDTEKPSLEPDLDTRTPKTGRCRCTIRDGMVEFHTDSTHENAGKTLELLEVNDT